jgi:hypothetical protein
VVVLDCIETNKGCRLFGRYQTGSTGGKANNDSV